MAACALVAALAVVAGCGGSKAVPGTADRDLPPPPGLQGATVMVLPVQGVRGLRGRSPDAEIAFALRERGERTEWVLPEDLQRILDRSPGVRVRLDALSVDAFRVREVRRIGDPLYGEIRRLGALSDADLALIPVQVNRRPAGEERPEAVEIAAALVEIRGGRVAWFGVVDAPVGDGGEARALAEAADALARALLPTSRSEEEEGAR